MLSSAFIIPMLLHFLSLNAQGFRNLDKQREIMHFASVQNVDVLFLQECNFRTPRNVSLFKESISVDAFFSLLDLVGSGVGVVFMRPRMRRGDYCTFGSNGRILAVDIYLFLRRLRTLLLNAPARCNRPASSFSSFEMFLFENYPRLLVGDFNCVLNPMRDVCGLGQGRPYGPVRELRELVSNFRLRDAWVHLYGSEFAAAWTRGGSGELA